MRRLLFIVAALLAGCASQNLERYAGQPITAVMIRNGPPANAFDLPDGRRAFQWARQSVTMVPGSAVTTGSATAVGGSVWWTQNTQIVGGQAYTADCVYTLYARWRDGAWMVEGFEPVPYACEDPLIR